MTAAELIAFEEGIKEAFLRAEIHAPVHLSDPAQAETLVSLFENVRPEDWVLSTYRSHFHALLKGVPVEDVRRAIMEGRSMYLCWPGHRFLSSAIVGGCLSIATGLAYGLRLSGNPAKVWCFLGDMAAETGQFYEAAKWSGLHKLDNLVFVVEDNGLSTNTPTREVWGLRNGQCDGTSVARGFHAKVAYYKYERTVPHVGAGQWVVFP